jgi:hypothetical protein
MKAGKPWRMCVCGRRLIEQIQKIQAVYKDDANQPDVEKRQNNTSEGVNNKLT